MIGILNGTRSLGVETKMVDRSPLVAINLLPNMQKSPVNAGLDALDSVTSPISVTTDRHSSGSANMSCHVRDTHINLSCHFLGVGNTAS